MNSNNNDKTIWAWIRVLRIFIFIMIAIPAGFFSVILGMISISTPFIIAIVIFYLLFLALLWVSLSSQEISLDRKVILWFLYIGFAIFTALVL
ncbi:hypothetical protein [Ignatzschineria sp. LJL83]